MGTNEKIYLVIETTKSRYETQNHDVLLVTTDLAKAEKKMAEQKSKLAEDYDIDLNNVTPYWEVDNDNPHYFEVFDTDHDEGFSVYIKETELVR